MFIATLIAAEALRDGDLSDAESRLRAAGIEPMGRSWIEADTACDLLFSGAPATARRALAGLRRGVDVIVQGEAGRRKALLIADMDSTMITVECIDELADYAGIKNKVAAITERAMRGELDFEAALTDRVGLLAGLDEQVIQQCYDERVRITPGAEALVRTMKAQGAYCLLVSGGFTHFAEKVANAIGFDRALANRLEVADGKLAGTVAQPILGAEAKLKALRETANTLGIELDDALAIGDGANDIPMLKAAGLGVAYHGKPAVIAAAPAHLEYNDLGALLYAQGYARSDWAA